MYLFTSLSLTLTLVSSPHLGVSVGEIPSGKPGARGEKLPHLLLHVCRPAAGTAADQHAGTAGGAQVENAVISAWLTCYTANCGIRVIIISMLVSCVR